MNTEEALVLSILKKNYQEKIIFEPDGNIPPDFKLGDHIAIEVRRLNQHHINSENAEGLEELLFPLNDAIDEVFESFGKQKSGFSYWAGICFRRPLSMDIYDLKKQIKKELDFFLLSNFSSFPYIVNISNEFTLEIYRTKSVGKNLFRKAIELDYDAGGFVISVYIENIQYCIDEKSKKIEPYLDKYTEWWLYLVDSMQLGLDQDDIKEVRKNIKDLGNFNKVCIIENGEEYLIFNN